MPVYHWAPLKKQQHTADFQRRTHTMGWWSRPAAVPPRAHTPTAPHGTGSRARQEQGHRTPSFKAAVGLQLQNPRQPDRRSPLTSRATLGPARRLPMVRPRPPRMRTGSPRAAALERSGAVRGRAGLGWVGPMLGRAALPARAHGAAGLPVGCGPASPLGMAPTQPRASGSQGTASRVVPLLAASCTALSSGSG